MNNSCLKLKVLRNLSREPLFAAFQEALCGGEPEKFYYQLYESGAENNFLSGLCELILADDNAFARTCARGDTPSSYLFDAYAGDIDAIFSAAARFEGDEHFRLGEPVPPFDGSLDGARSAAGLADHYAAHGYGKYMKFRAFTYSDGSLLPIENTSEVTLNDLKDYESEKEVRDFDLNILRNSNLLIVNFNKPDSIGTAQELAIAHELHIPVLGLNENRCELHPWLRECCDRIFDSMYELIEYTRFYYIERWEA